MFSAPADHVTCDDVDVREHAFTQLRALAVSLKCFTQLLLYGCGATQAIETHHLESQTHRNTLVKYIIHSISDTFISFNQYFNNEDSHFSLISFDKLKFTTMFLEINTN